LRIAALEPILVEVPFRRAVAGVHGTRSSQLSVLLRAVSDDGAEGWGNVDPTPGYSTMTAAEVFATARSLAAPLIGLDPFNVRRILGAMDAVVPKRFEAKALIEMALWDLKGRALGLPVHVLLGGRIHDDVTLNAWIGTVPPEQAAREALDWLGRGFTTAKIKVSGPGPEGPERVAAVRKAVGERMALRVDFNESLRREEAIACIDGLEPYRLTLCEQPISRDDIAGLAEIRRAVRTPLMADESVEDETSLMEIIRREAADIVKVKVMKQGGLLRTLRMIEIAAAAGIRSVVGHGFGLTPSTLAEVQVAACSEAVLPGCEAVGPLKMAGDVVTEPLVLDRGVITISDGPGFGFVIDPDAVKRLRVTDRP
jgi:L-alanine-DL-glutamate epimerase-like enolase superfamily enzyme